MSERDPRFQELDRALFSERAELPQFAQQRKSLRDRADRRAAGFRRPRRGTIYRDAPPLPPRPPKEATLAIAQRIEAQWAARVARASEPA